jgi:hypothetical protein
MFPLLRGGLFDGWTAVLCLRGWVGRPRPRGRFVDGGAPGAANEATRAQSRSGAERHRARGKPNAGSPRFRSDAGRRSGPPCVSLLRAITSRRPFVRRCRFRHEATVSCHEIQGTLGGGAPGRSISGRVPPLTGSLPARYYAKHGSWSGQAVDPDAAGDARVLRAGPAPG